MMLASSGRDVIAGYYGFGNFGDDLFRALLSRAISRKPWSRPTISQARPAPLDKVSRNLRAIGNIARARSITLGGGSILGARPPFGIRNVEMLAVTAKKIPYCAIGVGILENLSSRPDEIIQKMSWIGLRSEREFLELSPLYPHVHYTSDIAYAAPALLMDAEGGAPAKAAEIAVIPAQVGELGKAASDPAFVARWIEGNVLPFSKRGCMVNVVVLQPTNPADVALGALFLAAVERTGASARLFHHDDATESLRVIGRSAFVFTDRLHGAIVAHICGTPFRLSIHHQKCADLLADLGHPDAAPERSYSADTAGAGIASVEDWSAGQPGVVRRHADTANAGIAAWLDHLRERVG